MLEHATVVATQPTPAAVETPKLFAMETFRAAAKADVGDEACICACLCACV
jgi:hypothetical protein